VSATSSVRPIRSVSVLMPTWQGEEFLERVLAALAAQEFDRPWDFRVVDSGSTDRTLAILESWRERLGAPLAIESLHQSAFDHGDTRNLLAARSRGDLLVFLTQDAIPGSKHWLATLARNFEDPKVGAAYCRNVPRPDAELLTRVFSENDPGYTAGRRETRLPENYAQLGPHERRLLYNFNDVASAVRRELWERHPFPRAAFGEDVLLARALLEAGWTVVYDDIAVVEHSHDYGPEEMRKRCRIDGKFNAEHLDRVCIATRGDAEELTRRQLQRDREALQTAGFSGEALDSELAKAEALRRAAFVGLYEGGLAKRRYPTTKVLSKTKLRVLYVVHGFPPDTWAGTEVYTLGLALAMQRRGHEVALLTRAPAALNVEEGGPPDFSLHEDEFRGLKVWRMTHRLRHGSLRESYHQPKAEAAFREVLLRYKPDVVHFQHLIHLSATLPSVAREHGIPTLITVNDYWAVCARVQLIRPDGVRCEENQGMGCLVCVKDRDPAEIPGARKTLGAVAPLMGLLQTAGSTPGLAGMARYAEEFEHLRERHDVVVGGYDSADLLIAPSRFLRGKLLATGKFDPHKVLYSDYGTLTDNVRPIERKPDPSGRLRVGFVGSLLWYKGVDVLVSAMAKVPASKAELHVFGDYKPDSDPYHAKLRELAAAGGGKVRFHGRFDNQNIARVYEQIDVLCTPSTWFENSPITIHESFLFRTPQLVSDIGGMAELVRNGVDGLHFKVGDPGDLARQILRLCDEDGLYARLCANFPRIKTMAEDAEEMESRYRGLACIARESTAVLLLDKAGLAAVERHGVVERQRADLALLRPGGSWVEYDASTLGPGGVELRIELELFGGEAAVELSGLVSIDGREVGRIEALHAGAVDERRSVAFVVELASPARRLRIATDPERPAGHLRIARVVATKARSAPPSRPAHAAAH
jgi:glycosyltransferase involved in cell wall biosynthesis/GT2 family glycosyltransferase